MLTVYETLIVRRSASMPRSVRRGRKTIDMKKEDVPQDLSSLGKITKEVCYATDDSGKYSTELSRGWDIKIAALDTAWQDIRDRVVACQGEGGSKGPGQPPAVLYGKGIDGYQHLLAAYTGFWKWQKIQEAFETGRF